MSILDEQQNPISESSVSMQPVILKWGLISAVFSIISQLVSGMMGFGSMTMVISLLSFAIWSRVGCNCGASER